MSAATLKFSAMLDYVTDDLPDAGNDLVVQHIKLVARALCEKSRVWRYYPDALDVLTSEPEVDVFGPVGSEVCSIISARLSGTLLNPVVPLEAEEKQGIDLTGSPTNCWSPRPDAVRLFPIPNANYTSALVLSVALRPKLSAESMPAWLFESHIDTFKKGVRASLMGMKDKPWSNPNEGMKSQAEFDLSAGMIANTAFRGRMHATVNTRSVWM